MGPPRYLSYLISGWILWFMVDITIVSMGVRMVYKPTMVHIFPLKMVIFHINHHFPMVLGMVHITHQGRLCWRIGPAQRLQVPVQHCEEHGVDLRDITTHHGKFNIAMGNHHFLWENQLFLWPFSIAMLVYQRIFIVYMNTVRYVCVNFVFKLKIYLRCEGGLRFCRLS